MTDPALSGHKSFHRLVFITRDDLLAARWWHEGMQGAVTVSPNSRTALKYLVGLGGLFTGYVWGWIRGRRSRPRRRR